jgi:hypothetical protein
MGCTNFSKAQLMFCLDHLMEHKRSALGFMDMDADERDLWLGCHLSKYRQQPSGTLVATAHQSSERNHTCAPSPNNQNQQYHKSYMQSVLKMTVIVKMSSEKVPSLHNRGNDALCSSHPSTPSA